MLNFSHSSVNISLRVQTTFGTKILRLIDLWNTMFLIYRDSRYSQFLVMEGKLEIVQDSDTAPEESTSSSSQTTFYWTIAQNPDSLNPPYHLVLSTLSSEQHDTTPKVVHRINIHKDDGNMSLFIRVSGGSFVRYWLPNLEQCKAYHRKTNKQTKPNESSNCEAFTGFIRDGTCHITVGYVSNSTLINHQLASTLSFPIVCI